MVNSLCTVLLVSLLRAIVVHSFQHCISVLLCQTWGDVLLGPYHGPLGLRACKADVNQQQEPEHRHTASCPSVIQALNTGTRFHCIVRAYPIVPVQLQPHVQSVFRTNLKSRIKRMSDGNELLPVCHILREAESCVHRGSCFVYSSQIERFRIFIRLYLTYLPSWQLLW